MRRWFFVNSLILILGMAWANAQVPSVLSLPEGQAYIGAYVDAGPLSDEVDEQKVLNFEKLIGKKLAWIYFSNNWTDGEIKFPAANVDACRRLGRIPYIRLMPWSYVDSRVNGDPIFTMDAFLNGDFDQDLRQWALEAKKNPGHMILEFGPEVNGDWFPWNGRWNGAGTKNKYGDPNWPDGPEKFKDVYQRVIRIFRNAGLTDVTWVLHVDTARAPHTSWNKVKYYYPGDDYIDWIGLSVFGAQLPTHSWEDFLPKLKNFWTEIKETTSQKPIIISEFAVIEDTQNSNRKAQWLTRALKVIETQLYPIIGVTYWNSPGWLEDGSADFRITSSINSLEAFQKEISKPFWMDGTLPQSKDMQ